MKKLHVIEANWPPFTKTETRTGPPLGYVADKIDSALERCHELYQIIREETVVESHTPHMRPEYRQLLTFKQEIAAHCRDTFSQNLTALLALNNLLSIRNEKGIEEKLLAMDRKKFRRWLDYIITEGSVT